MTTAMLDAPTTAPATAAAPAWDAALAPTWKADFARDGLLVLPGLLDPATIAALKPEVDAIMAFAHTANRTVGQYRTVQRPRDT